MPWSANNDATGDALETDATEQYKSKDSENESIKDKDMGIKEKETNSKIQAEGTKEGAENNVTKSIDNSNNDAKEGAENNVTKSWNNSNNELMKESSKSKKVKKVSSNNKEAIKESTNSKKNITSINKANQELQKQAPESEFAPQNIKDSLPKEFHYN